MKHACKHDFFYPWTIIQFPWPYFWWSWFCGIYSLMLFILLFLKLMSWWWNIYSGLNLFDVVYITIFKTDVMMMKYIVRVEPPLMFNINRTRGHDVKEVVLPIGWRRWRKRDESEGEMIRRGYSILKNSSPLKRRKTAFLKNSRL